MTKKITITTGGSGGHVIPGLALATALHKHDVVVTWLGSKKGIESDLVPKAGIAINYISAYRIRNQGLLTKLISLLSFLPNLLRAIAIFRQTKPDLIIAMGGFVAFTGSVAAWILCIPLVVHEQNSVMGLANRYASKFAKQIFTAFPLENTKHKTTLAGNPVRENLLNVTPPHQRYEQRQGKLRLLILGGSAGAQKLNTELTRLLENMRADLRPKIWHQTGKKNLNTITQYYADKNIEAKVDGFIDDMAEAYAWSDLVISRAGATSISEIAATGVASILVPYSYSSDKHQHSNAQYLADTQGALLIEQRQLASELPALLNQLLAVETLDQLDSKRQDLAVMAQKVYQLPVCCKADQIAKRCLACIETPEMASIANA